MAGTAVGDHGEDQVDEEDEVIEPQGDEYDEPRPSDSLIESENQEYEEHQAYEPGEQSSVQYSHCVSAFCCFGFFWVFNSSISKSNSLWLADFD